MIFVAVQCGALIRCRSELTKKRGGGKSSARTAKLARLGSTYSTVLDLWVVTSQPLSGLMGSFVLSRVHDFVSGIYIQKRSTTPTL